VRLFFYLIKRNVKTITTWVVIFGVLMIISVIIALNASGAFN